MEIRYISDSHFGHKNIISYDNRPFSTVDEMDERMVALWNETVKPGDLTYVLGDFCWSQDYDVWAELIKRLKGRIFIIKGNHDRTEILKKLVRAKLIDGYSHQEIITDGGIKVVLNHSPMPFFVNMLKDNVVHLYGHVHISYDWNMTLNIQRQVAELYGKMPRMYNVGAMMSYVNYMPRTLKEIEDGFASADLLHLQFAERHG